MRKGEELDVQALQQLACPVCDTYAFNVWYDGEGKVAVSCRQCGLLLVS